VVAAVAAGKRAALAIDRYLSGQSLEGFPPLSEHVLAAPREVDPTVVTFEDINLAYFDEEPRSTQAQRPAETRVKDMGEVNLGFGDQEARHEAERCFSCGTCNGCDNCWVYCPDVAITRCDHLDYRVNYDYCKGCGMCAEECPRKAIAIEEELKWKK
jgi:2-oxoacid:acceptor oxidoreductase delta subunit (pyruvate/2-ketoisovalerate family)